MNQFARGIGGLIVPIFGALALFASSALADGHALTGTPQIKPQLQISYSLSGLASPDFQVYRPTNLWDRVRGGFNMEEVNPALIETHERWYQRHPGYLQRALERSRKYLYHIVDEVEKRGMPAEIALLPVIESAFNPTALSPRKASGIWQFIPSTGRIYGLKQTDGYDGRRDVLEATRAALDYLEDLHAMFGRWDLALGAYNCGEGCMDRALSRAGSESDYASLRLPTETKHYVPKLLAVRNIIQDPARFGIALGDVANEPYFMQVSLSRHMEAQQVARLAEMSLEEVFSLNPAYRGKIIRSDHTGVLLLPTDRVETFHSNLKQQETTKGLASYKAKKGELLKDIAAKFGVSLQWLKDRNPIKVYKGRLSKPTTLVVPTKSQPTPRNLTDNSRGDQRVATQGALDTGPQTRDDT